MSEWEVTVEARVKNIFYIEAESEEEAKNIANNMATTEIEKHRISVEDIEEVEVCED